MLIYIGYLTLNIYYYYYYSNNKIGRLHRIQNQTARILKRRCNHITPVSRELHWLRIHEIIIFNLLLLKHKTVYNTASEYVNDLIRLNVKGTTMCTCTYFEPLRLEDPYYKRINKTHTQKKLIYNHRNNTHNIYNIFCTYQNNPIEAVQHIFWIYVDMNRILKQVLLSTHSHDPGWWGESDVPACSPPASFSVHLSSSAVTPAGSVHKSRGDNVVRMWVQLKR